MSTPSTVLPRNVSGLAHFLATLTDPMHEPTSISNHDGFPAYRYESLDSDEFGGDDEFEAAEREHMARVEQDAMQAASPGGPR